MELRIVNVEDIHPDEKNPRKDFGDIDALAESCMLNEANPGEPVNPIVVVQDGGIYRIVDGERRYRAIKRNKLVKCHVTVCRDMDEVETLVSMITTDDKMRLSDLERSRGVQQMLLLGVDPVKVERTARLKKGDAMRVNRAMLKVDDAAEDMTLDRLCVIEEFADDAEAVERLTNCAEKDWEWIAADLRKAKEKAEQWAALDAALEAQGIEVVDAGERDEDAYPRFICSCESADRVREVAEGNTEGELLAVRSTWAIRVEIYTDHIADDDVDPEEQERKRKIAEAEGFIEAAKLSHACFIVSHLDDVSAIPHVVEALTAGIFDSGSWASIGREVKRLANLTDQDIPCEANGTILAYGYMKESPELYEHIAPHLVDAISDYYSDEVTEYLDWVAILESDGYAPTDVDRMFDGLCRSYLENMAGDADED